MGNVISKIKLFYYSNIMFDSFILNHALKIHPSLDYIINLCKKDPEYCRNKENRQKLRKKVLKVSGYTVLSPNTDFCQVYKELASFAKNSFDSCKVKQNYIALTFSDGSLNTDLIEMIEKNKPSSLLVTFLNDNGYNIQPPKPSPTLSDILADMNVLSNNNKTTILPPM